MYTAASERATTMASSSDEGGEYRPNLAALDPKERKRYQNRVAQRTYRRS